jgi:hypothetical protein
MIRFLSIFLLVSSSLCAEVIFSTNFDEGKPTSFTENLLKRKAFISLADKSGVDQSAALKVAYIPYERGSKRVVYNHNLGEQITEATLSFDVKFDHDFIWAKGGKLHGLGPKKPVTGGAKIRDNRWSTRFMFKQDGEFISYLYHQGMKGKYGDAEKLKNFKAQVKGNLNHLPRTDS